jgi:hypothetical protein
VGPSIQNTESFNLRSEPEGDLKGFWPIQTNSQVRLSEAFGVLKLELGQDSYAWEFVSEGGQILDSGAGQCHPKRQQATLARVLYEDSKASVLWGQLN